MQTYACKRYMCVNLKTSNDAVLGDCGRYPMYIESTKRCLSYWLKILKMQDHRYVRKCYNMMRHYDQLGYTNWSPSCIELYIQTDLDTFGNNKRYHMKSCFLHHLYKDSVTNIYNNCLVMLVQVQNCVPILASNCHSHMNVILIQ